MLPRGIIWDLYPIEKVLNFKMLNRGNNNLARHLYTDNHRGESVAFFYIPSLI
jgi:hypothetical protein